jgi:pimeloyl-ACP methyl ester carboxylesterase/CRP-like cAMP-binding protein
MSTYTINGQPIYIWEQGPADAPIAVLIHGWSSSSFTWAPLLPVLSKRYRCLALDLPGFGQSPAPKTPPTIRDYAELVAQVIATFSREKSVLVLGHSMGGQIAATLALHHPMLVEQMVLLNPAMSGRLSTRVKMLLAPHVLAERYPFMEWLIYVLAQTPLDYTDYLLKPTSFAERAQVSAADYQRIREDARRRGQGKVRAACYGAMKQGDLRGQLGTIEPPALVIWGAEDNIVPLRDAGAVAEEWSRADLRLIPNAGHWPQFEQTETTLRHIEHYLGLPPELKGEVAQNQELADIQHTAQFLNNCEIGGKLNKAQRLRLASLVRVQRYRSGEIIARTGTFGDEMYIVREGTLEVQLRTNPSSRSIETAKLATMQSGEVVGELSLLDDAPRSADLVAGPQGATVLVLTRTGLDTLAIDDPEMGMRLMQNLAVSLGKRLRKQNWLAAKAEASARAA